MRGQFTRRRYPAGVLQQLREFIDGETRLADDGAEGSPVYFLMVRDDQLPVGLMATEDDVAAFLAREDEANLA